MFVGVFFVSKSLLGIEGQKKFQKFAKEPCLNIDISNQYLKWLRGFRVKIAHFSSFFCPSIPKRELDTKKTPKDINICPRSHARICGHLVCLPPVGIFNHEMFIYVIICIICFIIWFHWP